MKLRTHLNLVVAGLTSAFVVALIVAQVETTHASVHAEIEAAHRVAVHLLQPLAAAHANEADPGSLRVLLERLGRVRANDIELRSASGATLYRSPPPTYKAGRQAPHWFVAIMTPPATRSTLPLPGGATLSVDAHSSRAVLDAWDDLVQLLGVAAGLLLIVNSIAFWLVDRALEPFPLIAAGLDRLERGELAFRLPPLAGSEASMIGAAFNRMARAIEDKVRAERLARDAETRLEERREMALLVEQSVEEERRLIAHELHDEFGQSVTAIRSLALSIAGCKPDDPRGETARLIATEAARLYDAMHGLIPRLMPPSLDTSGLAQTLQDLVRDWQRRYPLVRLSLRQEGANELGSRARLTVYRLVQEGLINALRHAQPSHVDITVTSASRSLIVTVADDGVGLPAQWSRPGHFGLRGLAERVERLGGVMHVGNRVPRGATLRAEIPLEVPA